jgi:hypothetical protein
MGLDWQEKKDQGGRGAACVATVTIKLVFHRLNIFDYREQFTINVFVSYQ